MPTNDTLIRGLCPQPRQVQLTEGQFPLPSVLTWTGPDEVINAVTILTERLAPALDVVRATSHTDDASLTVIVDPALEAEGYRIDIDAQVRITVGSPSGARWAVQTLLQLLTPWVYGPGPLALKHLPSERRHRRCATPQLARGPSRRFAAFHAHLVHHELFGRAGRTQAQSAAPTSH